MATPAQPRPKEPIPLFKNDEGLNVVSSAFEIRPSQARVAENVVSLKTGGLTNRNGQVLVNSTQPAGNPEYLKGIVFSRTTLAGVRTIKKIAVGGDGKVYDFSTDPPTAVLTGLTPGAMPDLAVVEGWLLLCNGIDQPKKWDMTNWRRWGIAAPAGTPTVTVDAAGSPSGTYRFRVSFRREQNDIDPGSESSMGAISSYVSVASQRIFLTDIPVSADPQVTSRNIEVEIGGFWYVVSASEPTLNDNTTTSYYYDAFDSDTVLNSPGRTDRDPPENDIKIIELHQGIMFGSNGKILDWTPLNEFEAFDRQPFGRTSNAYDPSDGYSIVGLRSCTDLIVAKERSLFVRSGDDLNYTNTHKVFGHGVISRDSMIAHGTVLRYLSHDGFHEFDGSGDRNISYNIQPLLFGNSLERIVDQVQLNRVTGTAYDTNVLATDVWSIPTATGASAITLVYHYTKLTVDPAGQTVAPLTGQVSKPTVGAWFLWNNLDARCVFTFPDVDSKQDTLFSGGKDGFLRILDSGDTDLGNPISCRYRPGEVIGDNPFAKKRLRDVLCAIEATDPSVANPQIAWWVNGSPSGVTAQFIFGDDDFPVFDTALFDTAVFPPEGTMVGVAGYSGEPFYFIAPELSWAVPSEEGRLSWLGFMPRLIDAGIQRPQGA